MATKKKLTAEEAAAKEKESVQVTLHIFKVLLAVAAFALAISVIAFCFTGCSEISSLWNDTELAKLFDEVGKAESAFLTLEGNSYSYTGDAICIEEGTPVYSFDIEIKDNVAYLAAEGKTYQVIESGSSITVGAYTVTIGENLITFTSSGDVYEFALMESK